MEQIRSLTIDGVSYGVEQFSEQLKKNVLFYEQLLRDGEELNLEVAALQYKIDVNRAATMFMHGQLSSQAKDELEMLKKSISETQETDSAEG